MPESGFDPEYVEFLKSEAERINEQSDAFFDRYGFRHTCRCAEAATDGKTLFVSACWAEMMDRAFDQLVRHRSFIREIFADEILNEDFPGEKVAAFLDAGD